MKSFGGKKLAFICAIFSRLHFMKRPVFYIKLYCFSCTITRNRRGMRLKVKLGHFLLLLLHAMMFIVALLDRTSSIICCACSNHWYFFIIFFVWPTEIGKLHWPYLSHGFPYIQSMNTMTPCNNSLNSGKFVCVKVALANILRITCSSYGWDGWAEWDMPGIFH